MGEWSIADAAVTPFLARAAVSLGHGLGAFDVESGARVWKILQEDPKYARFRKYYADVSSRESFKETFDEVSNAVQLWTNIRIILTLVWKLYIREKYEERATTARAQRSVENEKVVS